MGMETRRLFIGNLPESVDEEFIKTRFSKYGNVHSVEVKQRKANTCFDSADDGGNEVLSTFAFINISTDNNSFEKCIHKLSKKKWDGNECKIEYAKESALDRLKRERLELANSNNKSTINKSLSNSCELKNHDGGKDNVFRNLSNNHCPTPDAAIPNAIANSIHKFSSLSSEQKRLKSLEEKNSFIALRKQTVKAALSSVDTSTGNNRKIIFKDSDEEDIDNSGEETNKNGSKDQQLHRPAEMILSGNNTKNNLFEDTSEDSETESSKLGFEIREQFEGVKGQKLFQLQSKFRNDSRFTLDRRFAESSDDTDDDDSNIGKDGKHKKRKKRDDDVEGDDDNEENAVDGHADEINRQLEILGSVVGQQIVKPSQSHRLKKQKTNNVMEPRNDLLCVRYDPTKTDHERFIVKPPQKGEVVQEGKKKDKKRKEEEEIEREKESEKNRLEEKEKTETNEEGSKEVSASKETYYEVASDLKERLRSGGTFSFSQMFGSDNAQTSAVNTVKHSENKPVQKERSSFKDGASRNFKTTSTISQPASTSAFSTLWNQSFFFKENDDRFKEAIRFLENEEDVCKEDFAEKRKELRCIVKKKMRHAVWKKEAFKRKFNRGSNMNFKRKL